MTELRRHRITVLEESMAAVAERAGLPMCHLSNFERGMAVAEKYLEPLATGYRVSVDELRRMLASPIPGGIAVEDQTTAIPDPARIPARGAEGAAG